jgi:hypothetical protein
LFDVHGLHPKKTGVNPGVRHGEVVTATLSGFVLGHFGEYNFLSKMQVNQQEKAKYHHHCVVLK